MTQRATCLPASSLALPTERVTACASAHTYFFLLSLFFFFLASNRKPERTFVPICLAEKPDNPSLTTQIQFVQLFFTDFFYAATNPCWWVNPHRTISNAIYVLTSAGSTHWLASKPPHSHGILQHTHVIPLSYFFALNIVFSPVIGRLQ